MTRIEARHHREASSRCGRRRALCSLEMFVGVMDLAAMVSRLIGLTLLRRQ